jgi:dipeptidase D
MSFVSQLAPRSLWRHFDDVLAIPRPPGGEAGIRAHVAAVADRHGLGHRRDAAGNLVVAVPATAGRENVAPTALQAHLDMVGAARPGSAHDFARDPIAPRLEPRDDGGWLGAEGTTLGADNGIGVAALLALAAPDLDDGSPPFVHGPLELLLTVEEESGLRGAGRLDPTLLTARRLVNLDAEDDGVIVVGSAGCAGCRLTLPLAVLPAPSGLGALEVRLGGLRGGHSGLDIERHRGNALQLLARLLRAAREAEPCHLAAFAGGDGPTSIPREAAALVAAPASRGDSLARLIAHLVDALELAAGAGEPGLLLRVAAAPPPALLWGESAAETALDLLQRLPHGVLATSVTVPGRIEASSCLASAAQQGESLVVLLSQRSTSPGFLAELRAKARALAQGAGARLEESDGYGAWQADPASPLLAAARAAHRRALGTDPELKTLHAGLECARFAERVPGLDMISIGPRIEMMHTPDERVHIGSVAGLWHRLGTLLAGLSSG